jgi:hypothetical protein
VAVSQRPKSTSTNKQGVGDEAISAAVERYTRDLERAPLAVRTRDAYGQHVGAYGAWLAGRPEPGVAITEPRGRDHAARDFKRHLKVERGWKPSSVNLALAAVDHFNRFLGLGPANVKREPLAQAAPKALSEEQQRALLRAAEASRPRDRAIVTLLLYSRFSSARQVSLPHHREGSETQRRRTPPSQLTLTQHWSGALRSGARRALAPRDTSEADALHAALCGARGVRREMLGAGSKQGSPMVPGGRHRRGRHHGCSISAASSR